MPLIDDLKFDPSDEELARRKFLGLGGGAALAIVGLGSVITTVRFLEPNVLFEEASRFRVARAEDVPVGTLLVLERQQCFVLRTERGFVAMSSVCTHLGCMTRYEKTEGRIFCPCHGSEFDAHDGHVTGGPAPRPLSRLKLTIDKGWLVVDTKAEAGPGETLEV